MKPNKRGVRVRSTFIYLAFMTIVMLGMVAVAPGLAVEPKVVKFASIAPRGHPIADGMFKFAELVGERTNGRVEVQVFPAGELGGEPDIQDALRAGSIQAALLGSTPLSMLTKRYTVDGVFFLYRDWDHFEKVWSGPIAWDLAKEREKYGLRTLTSIWAVGWRHVISKRPIRKLEDFGGLKIRVPTHPLFVKGFEALGASPVGIQFPEVYTALQLGTVDAMECPLDWIYRGGFYEVAKYLTLTRHAGPNIMNLEFNDEFWQTLPEDVKVIIAQSAVEAGRHSNQLMKEGEEGYRKRMEEAEVTFLTIDREPLSEQIEKIVPELAPLWDNDMDLFEKLKESGL